MIFYTLTPQTTRSNFAELVLDCKMANRYSCIEKFGCECEYVKIGKDA